jgi:hypothetical protein
VPVVHSTSTQGEASQDQQAAALKNVVSTQFQVGHSSQSIRMVAEGHAMEASMTIVVACAQVEAHKGNILAPAVSCPKRRSWGQEIKG